MPNGEGFLYLILTLKLSEEFMAMTKAEMKQVEDLKTLLALRHHEPVEKDVDIPESGIVNGWDFNIYTKSVSKTCSSISSHNFGQWDKTNAQQPIKQYSSKMLAYKALLHAMAMLYAKEMREVEIKMKNDIITLK